MSILFSLQYFVWHCILHSGFVFFTIIFFCHLQKRILDFTKYEMLNKALDAFHDLGEDEELGPVDWPTVKRYIASLNNLEGERQHPYEASETANNLDPTSLRDIRMRLLNGKNVVLLLLYYCFLSFFLYIF